MVKCYFYKARNNGTQNKNKSLRDIFCTVCFPGFWCIKLNIILLFKLLNLNQFFAVYYFISVYIQLKGKL